MEGEREEELGLGATPQCRGPTEATLQHPRVDADMPPGWRSTGPGARRRAGLGSAWGRPPWHRAALTDTCEHTARAWTDARTQHWGHHGAQQRGRLCQAGANGQLQAAAADMGALPWGPGGALAGQGGPRESPVHRWPSPWQSRLAQGRVSRPLTQLHRLQTHTVKPRLAWRMVPARCRLQLSSLMGNRPFGASSGSCGMASILPWARGSRGNKADATTASSCVDSSPREAGMTPA